MPIFYLNDKPVEFEKGETILKAALRAGTEIPHYCYHPGLKITAQCRMCLVEITDMGNGRGMPKLQTSCSTPAGENMKVSSVSEKAHWGQNLVNEFLLVNHPLDCPICDQAGECDLQNYAHRYGTGHSEMAYEKRVYGWRNVGSFLMLERNRCVQCSRCERFSRDIVGTHDFGAFLRTHELTFDTWGDSEITHKFQGNLADICPVGAITSRDWRFKKRAWKLHKTPTVCTACSTGCNITLEHHENRVFRVKPRENQAVNRWWMCDEGRESFPVLNNRRERILEPQARVKGELQAASWDAIEKAVAHRLQEIGANGAQVLGLTDTHATNEELFVFKQLLSEGFGSDQLYFPYRPGTQQEKPPRYLADTFVYSLITTDKSPNTAGALKAGLIGDEDDKRLKAALKAAPKVVFILGTPFVNDVAVREAVSQADLIVAIGTLHNPWVELADVVLPGHTHGEKDGTFLNKAERLQRIRPALDAPEGTRDQVGILASLLALLGKEPAPASAEAAFNAMGQQDGPFKGLSWEAVGPQGLPLGGAKPAQATA
ncbi:MAG TPA: molybdopterin-dependent oxidoreductase [bacterium]|nr:molybdopterin-dependent oxidoreductase [bacterium]